MLDQDTHTSHSSTSYTRTHSNHASHASHASHDSSSFHTSHDSNSISGDTTNNDASVGTTSAVTVPPATTTPVVTEQALPNPSSIINVEAMPQSNSTYTSLLENTAIPSLLDIPDTIQPQPIIPPEISKKDIQ